MKNKIIELTGKKKIGLNIAKWSEIKTNTGIRLLNEDGTRSKEERAISKNQGAYIYAISKNKPYKNYGINLSPRMQQSMDRASFRSC